MAGRARRAPFSDECRAGADRRLRTLIPRWGARQRVAARSTEAVEDDRDNPLAAARTGVEPEAPANWDRPEDVAAAALYLAAPENTWVTGAVLTVDGGFSVR